MKHGKLLLGIFFLFLSFSISAQNFGVRVGILHNNIELKHPFETLDYLGTESKLGFYGGYAGRIFFNKYLGVGGEFLFIKKGFKEWTGNKNNLQNIDLNYLAIPIMVKIRPIKHLSIDAGAEFSYMIKSNPDYYNFEKFDLSWIGGISFLINEKIEMSIRYSYSIKAFDEYNLTDDVGVNIGKLEYFNRNVQLGGAYYF